MLNQLANHTPSVANGYANWSPCDTLAEFIAGLKQLASFRGRICLVFDKAERLAQHGHMLHTLLALPALSVGVPLNIVFVSEAPFPEFGTQPWLLSVDFSRLLRIHFPGYSSAELSTVIKRDALHVATRVLTDHISPVRAPKELSRSEHEEEDAEPRTDALVAAFNSFAETFVESFSPVCRDTHELRHMIRDVFPEFVKPALDGRNILTPPTPKPPPHPTPAPP